MYTASYAGTRADAAYAELKRLVLLGRFPINVRLGEERLAARLEMSRTPIREALVRLHAEGLVARYADGGFYPAIPDVVEVYELYEVRAALELHAVGRPAVAARVHDRRALADLLDEWRALAVDHEGGGHEAQPSFVLLDEAFHVALAEAAGNQALVEQLRQVNDRIRIVRMQDFLVTGRVRTTVREHVGILEALLAGDVAECESRLRSHIEASQRFVQHRVAEAITRMTRRST